MRNEKLDRRGPRSLLALLTVISVLAGMVVTSATANAAPAPTGWSPLASVQAPVGGILAISCATTTHCVAIDHGGNVVSFEGSTWSPPVQINNGAPLIALSCPTTTRCVALDALGNAIVETGTTWAVPRNVFGAEFPRAISCGSPIDCVAVGANGNAFTFTGTHWNPAQLIDPGQSLTSISCPDPTNCVAVDAGGNSVAEVAGSWSTPVPIDTSTTGLVAISCPAPATCTALDGAGYAFRSTGGTFDSGTLIGHPNGAMTALSCPNLTTCVATNDSGDFATFSGTGWSAPGTWGSGPIYTVSCPPGTTTCVAATYGDDGLALTITNNVVTSSVLIDERNDLTGVACVAGGSCVAIDRAGATLVATNQRWSLPVRYGVDPASLIAISCPSATTCMELGADGTLTTVTVSGSLPSATSQLVDAGATPIAMSCATTSSCMVIDTLGRAIPVRSGTAGAPMSLGLAGTPTAISCASSTTCVATDSKGNVATLTAGRWIKQTVDAPATTGLVAISCATTTFCVAVDGDGYAAIRTPTGWLPNAISADQSGSLTSISCPAAGYCVAVDRFLNVVTYAKGSWSTPVSLFPTKAGPTSAFISCASTTTCTVVTGQDQSSTFAAPPTNPVATAMTPAVLGQGATSVLSFVNGARLDKLAVITASKKGITFAKATISGSTRLRTLTSVGPSVAPGPVDIVVADYPRGTAICHNCLMITAAPVVTSSSVHTVRQGATGDMVTLRGTGFVTGSLVTTPLVGVVFRVISRSSTSLTCSIAVAKKTVTGPIPLVVTNPDHGTSSRVGLLSVTH